MKIFKKYINLAVFLFATLFAGCVDTDVAPEGNISTSEQKEEIAEMLPERLLADLNGMYAILGKQEAVFPDEGRHDDFGYPSLCIMHDSNGGDLVSTDASYNWYSTSASFQDRTYSYAVPTMRYQLFYQQIKVANNMLSVIPEDTEDKELLAYKAQALAMRAFDYFNLVQYYQFTYKGNESKPAVPIVLPTLTNEQRIKNPRATVQQVYDLILADLNEAIKLLAGVSQSNKGAIDQRVAYGIRARVNLVMKEYAKAAEDAAKARAGVPLLSLDEVSRPGFNDVQVSSCMWGVIINPTNISDEYASWPSKLASFSGKAYATQVGQYKSINNLLWNKIPVTDIRKHWWVDAALNSNLLIGLSWPGHEGEAIGPLKITDVKAEYLPYTNVKFGGYKNEIGNRENASDWIMMRAEEMLLIEVEGLAMSGQIDAAKTMLTGWITANRDPDYVCTAGDPDALQTEVWFQRRVELWGEGFAYFDLMRLKKNMVRFKTGVESNWPEKFKFNLRADDEWLLNRIPRDEINGNQGITDADNNGGGAIPQSGDGASLTDGVTN